jgi:release factor glutamine methyltransferase
MRMVHLSVSRSISEATVRRLREAGCVAAEDEAAELVAAAPDRDMLDAWIIRREAGEPLAWIIGRATFCGHRLRVDPGIYVPRPQTEELARRGADLMAAGASRAVDLCTGSGAVAAHLASATLSASVVGLDLDPRAAACARRNGVRAIVGDLDDPLRPHAFDVVTAVAPYVPTDELRLLPADVQRYEPTSALDGGPDGLRIVGRVVEAAARLLRTGGWLLLEVGGDQDRALAPTLAGSGFHSVDPWFDEEGDLRGLAAQVG